MEERLDEIKETVKEVKAVMEQNSFPRLSGVALYVMIGIGWGLGIAKESGDVGTGAVSGLLWPISMGFQLAKYYWH